MLPAAPARRSPASSPTPCAVSDCPSITITSFNGPTVARPTAGTPLQLDTTLYCFGMSDSGFGDHFAIRPHERMGKVYRRTYRFQPQSLPNQPGALKEGIPSALNTPFIRDVSNLYFDGIDVTLKLTVLFKPKKRFVYLAVFDNQNWVPVAWSRVRHGRATFSGIEKGCAYMAAYYHEGRLHPASDPFTVSKEGTVTPTHQ